MRDKRARKENRKMNTDVMSTAKGMADFLLAREHRGPGDTIEAAAYRIQHKFGVPVALLMRLRHRSVKDMLASNLMMLTRAYQTASERIDKAYEHEKSLAIDPKIVRLAALVAGEEVQPERDLK